MTKGFVGIIGAGDIGFNLAEILALQGYDVLIHNRYHEVDGQPSPYWLSKQGTVMDMNDSLQLPHCGEVRLVHQIEELTNASVIVVTAGAKRTNSAETREELASKNAVIMRSYAPFLAKTPESLVMIVSNPVDALTQFMIQEVAELTKHAVSEVAKKIVGVSLIDTMRLKNAVKEFLEEQKSPLKKPVIEGLALGEHGPSMVPLMSHVTINGTPLAEFASTEQARIIAEHTILRGNDIIKLTGASSVVGPAHAVMHMILQINQHKKVQLPCSVWDGQRCIGRLVEFEGNKALKVLEVTMSAEEQAMLRKSEHTLDKQYKEIISRLETR